MQESRVPYHLRSWPPIGRGRGPLGSPVSPMRVRAQVDSRRSLVSRGMAFVEIMNLQTHSI